MPLFGEKFVSAFSGVTIESFRLLSVFVVVPLSLEWEAVANVSWTTGVRLFTVVKRKFTFPSKLPACQ